MCRRGTLLCAGAWLHHAHPCLQISTQPAVMQFPVFENTPETAWQLVGPQPSLGVGSGAETINMQVFAPTSKLKNYCWRATPLF